MTTQEESRQDPSQYESVALRMHPRVFSALGANLVTNDVVAIIELVKNSYDAFAQNVRIKFTKDDNEEPILQVVDDGTGMTRQIIEDVWCQVATPYKDSNPTISKEGKQRRVVGEKGLGRLSAARLGDRLTMLTQAANSPCWEVVVDWASISHGDDLSQSYVRIREYPGQSPFHPTGTQLSIAALSSEWDSGRIEDLEDNLTRLISPFSQLDDFHIFLDSIEDAADGAVHIQSPAFLSHPKYSITGAVDDGGNIEGVYRFAPLGTGRKGRIKEIRRSWQLVFDDIVNDRRYSFSPDGAGCGPFSFEIRAWDIAAADTTEISETFGHPRRMIRRAISSHKGISVYRDGILVLPKSETARDWLGLDLRRVSDVGKRLSTSQLVGYVSISADSNPKVSDTSDRERLASCAELSEFEALIRSVVDLLEIERGQDRTPITRERTTNELFSALTAEPLVEQVSSLANQGAQASSVIPLVRDFSGALAVTRKSIEERFVYYSRLATIGTIAQMVIHEIRNRTIVLGSLLSLVKNRLALLLDPKSQQQIDSAQGAVDSLESLADSFAPLASRNYRRGQRNSVLEDRLRRCLLLHQREIRNRGIKTTVPESETRVAVDPGELDAICLNLIANATFWLGEVPKDSRELLFAFESINNGARIRVWVHDTGPGIEDDDIDRIFLPGVTRKPGGIGMGLTVASELVEAYGGQMLTKQPGEHGGASFAFDLPLIAADQDQSC